MGSNSTIVEVLESHGEFAHGGNARAVAEDWDDAGFAADEVDAWLGARCFDDGAASILRDAGVTPEQASATVGEDEGNGGYSDTIGYKLSNNDLRSDRAIELAKGEGGG